MYRIIGADGKEYGPITADVLRQWIAEGRANASTNVLSAGATEWKPLGTLPEFSLLFAAQPATPAIFPITPIRRPNGFATAGFILGLVSLVFCCSYGLPLNLLGLVFSIVALVQIRSNREMYSGDGMAIAGLILSLISIVFYIAILIFVGLAGALGDVSHHVQRL